MKANKGLNKSDEFEIDQNNDQLKVIFDLIGKQSREDLEGTVKNSRTINYCEELQQTVTTK